MLSNINQITKSNSSLFPLSQQGYTKLIEKYTRDRELRPGKILHGHLITNALARLTHYASKLIIFYVECSHLHDARKVFDKIPKTNIRRWIVLIGAYARHKYHDEAMSMFSDMQREGLKVSKYVLPSVLKSCGHLVNEQTGRKIHCVVIKYGFDSDAFVNSALIDMYSKCRRVENAKRVYDEMSEKDVVALNAMVSGYILHGLVKKAFEFIQKTEELGVKPNLVTWNTLIAGFSQSGDDSMVSELFRLMRVYGVEPDVVSWTSVVSGFVQNFRNDKAFATFKQMMEFGLFPSPATISSLLPACAVAADFKKGREIHGYAVVAGMEKDIYVRSALIDMYAKCGLVYEAKTLFGNMSDRNTVTWNSMIFGYANHGYCTEAIELFNKMVKDEEKLDHLTFTAVLTACAHAGMVELGKSLFVLMREKMEIEPRLEHYACMVDLLGKKSKIDEAYKLISEMPIEPDKFVWGALLGACKQHGNVEIAEIAAKRLIELEPDSRGSSLLMKGLYENVGQWGNVVRVKKMMKKRKFTQFPGCSWLRQIYSVYITHTQTHTHSIY